MIKIVQIIILVVLNFNQVYALPSCTGDYYHNCDGKRTDKFGTYVGEFKNDRKNGYGEQKFHNGDKYKGRWTDNNFHGYGTYIFSSSGPSTERKIFDQHQKGLRHGFGTNEDSMGKYTGSIFK